MSARTVSAAVLDYEAGNLRSVEKSLQRAGFAAFVTDSADRAAGAELVVVPGVGHFGQCVRQFDAAGFAPLIRERIAHDRPVLGICVGMQIMYAGSEEDDAVEGFGFLPGRVRRFAAGLTVPHMGWNVATATGGDRLLAGVEGQRVYFVHSYYAVPDDPRHVIATADYGGAFPCAVREGPFIGTQFHPEKSADVGRRLLTNLHEEIVTAHV